MWRVPGDGHLFELADGRTIGHATWGFSPRMTACIGHGILGSRMGRCASVFADKITKRPTVVLSILVQGVDAERFLGARIAS